MTTQQLEEALVREKEKAEKALGCDMCKKYARCLYCFSKDEFRCAKAHDRLMLVLEQGKRKFPAYLLHEPPMEVLEGKQPSQFAEKKPAGKTARAASKTESEDSKEERVETIAHILSDYDMNSLSEERTKELMKISAMLDSTEENAGASARVVRSQEERVLVHTERSEDDPPLLIIRKRRYH